MKIFLHHKSWTHTQTPIQNLTIHFTCHSSTFCWTFVFFPLTKREDLFLFSLFPLCILDNTGVTIIYIYYHCPCYSYFIATWWEMQKLLSKYITRKQETWQISRSILFRDAKRRALFSSEMMEEEKMYFFLKTWQMEGYGYIQCLSCLFALIQQCVMFSVPCFLSSFISCLCPYLWGHYRQARNFVFDKYI